MYENEPIAETTILRFGEGVDTVHCMPLAVQDCAVK